jgi:hypothetical protein
MTIIITRNYAHRTFGAIGSVELTAPSGKYMLDGKELPEQSVNHLLTFALQTLQDAYAGADDAAEAIGAFGKKLDKLIAGTLGTRSGGDGVDEFTTVARQMIRTAMKSKLGAKSPEWAAFTGLADADQNVKLDANYAKNEAHFKPFVEAKVAERSADRARKAAMNVGFEL